MKRRIVALLTLAALLVAQAALAATSITPYYNYTRKVTAELTISGGKATCTGKITADASTSQITMKMYLEKSTDGKNWSNVETWDDSGSGLVGAGLSKTKSISSGFSYRVRVTGVVTTVDGKIERPKKTSSIKTY